MALLPACTSTSAPQVTAAPEATSPTCVTALASAPSTVAGRARTSTAVAGALAWGDPATVLRCGLPAPGPTRDRCLGVNGVDWVVDTDDDPYVFISYGRNPAVELRVPASYGNDDAFAAVVDVGPVASALPRTGHACIGPADVPSGSTSGSAQGPSPTSSAGTSAGPATTGPATGGTVSAAR